MFTSAMIVNPIELSKRLQAAERVCRAAAPIVAVYAVVTALPEGESAGLTDAQLCALRDALIAWRRLTDGA